MATTQIIAEPGVSQIVVSREFDAPCDLLFRAHTDPDLLVQWLGPRGLTMTIDRLVLETTTFEELGGKALLTQNSVFQSAGDRDRALQSGMADGAIESMDRLDELLTRLALVS